MSVMYRRPAKTEATAVGNLARSRWTRLLRERVHVLLPSSEFERAEQGLKLKPNQSPRNARVRWVTTGIRIDQMAILNLLQARHLQATGKEISKAETLAALMAAGLQTILERPEFQLEGDTNGTC